jgi:hypothetical protein
MRGQTGNSMSVELFLEAHAKAKRQDLLARLLGRPNDLLPFETLIGVLQAYERIPHRTPEMIPLNRIVGSVGRHRDFTRDFLPRNRAAKDRWASVGRGMSSNEGLPPIEVFKVGDVYFVADGNHRASVARANGFDAVDAYVTEYPIDPGLQPGDSLDQAILKAGRAHFLAETKLDEHVPESDIRFTEPIGYARLLEHVAANRQLMREQDPQGPEPTLEAAALDWYANSYQPIVAQIRDRQLLKRFPGRTEADLYVWVSRYIAEICRLFGEDVGAEEGAALLELRPSPPFRQAVETLVKRLLTGSDRNAAAAFPGQVAPEEDMP